MIGARLRRSAPPLIRAPALPVTRRSPEAARSPQTCACGGGCPACQSGASGPERTGREAEAVADAAPAAPGAGGTAVAVPVAQAAPVGSGPVLQRAPDPSVDAERAQFVDKVIASLESGPAMVSDAANPMDRARFDRLMDAWLSAVVKTERVIDAGPAGLAARKTDLRAAYKAVIAALISRWSAESGQSEADLYRANSGRIPLWAWPKPHRLEAGFSTPLAEGTAVDPASGEATFTLNGFGIRILPDGVDATLKPGTAKTEGGFPKRFMPGMVPSGGKITRIDPTPRQIITIQTLYGPGTRAASPSGYGRGRTAEDVAGSAVLPRSRTLGFHEGEHGLAMLDYVRSHPPPQFHGRVGMTLTAFAAEEVAFNDRLSAYQKAMVRHSERTVDCAGTVTIDDHARSKAAAGTTVSITCGP